MRTQIAAADPEPFATGGFITGPLAITTASGCVWPRTGTRTTATIVAAMHWYPATAAGDPVDLTAFMRTEE